MIESLPTRLAALPADARAIAERILCVESAVGQALPPPSMEAWVAQQFGDIDAVRNQTIVSVTNRLTLESALFNPLRARRPSLTKSSDEALEAWIARELDTHDMFRDPERNTTADVFGRVRGQYCITASNVAKYEGWHGLVIFDEPHPLRFGAAQIADYLVTASRWMAAAHACDPNAVYPIITWNCLPKSGATLMHGHMQIALARGMPYARVELWRRAAEAYRASTTRNYFADVVEVHDALGLAVPAGDRVRAFAHLTPMRNNEVVMLCNSVADVAPAFYALLRSLIDLRGVRAFNLAIALPPLEPTTEDWRDVPIVVRIADRGNPLSDRSDIGAMELYGTGCITVDPFDVATQLQTHKNDADDHF